MSDLDKRVYTPGEIDLITRNAERRGREMERASERTIEPMPGEMPPAIPNELAQVSHAGLALSVGDCLQRIAQLEAALQRLVTPEQPAYVEHEPTPTPPVDTQEFCECEEGATDPYVKGADWVCSACDYPVKIKTVNMGEALQAQIEAVRPVDYEHLCTCGHKWGVHRHGEVTSCVMMGCKCNRFDGKVAA